MLTKSELKTSNKYITPPATNLVTHEDIAEAARLWIANGSKRDYEVNADSDVDARIEIKHKDFHRTVTVRLGAETEDITYAWMDIVEINFPSEVSGHLD